MGIIFHIGENSGQGLVHQNMAAAMFGITHKLGFGVGIFPYYREPKKVDPRTR